MTKKGIFILLGFIALIVGGIIIGIGISKKEYQNNNNSENIKITEEITEGFTKIKTDLFVADVKLVKSTDSKNTIYLSYNEKQKISYIVENGTLKIKQEDFRISFNFMNFIYNDKSEVIIYLNETTLDELEIKTSTGDVLIGSDFVVNNATITVSTGDIDVGFKTNGGLVLTSSTGDITIKNSSSDSLTLASSTGKTIIENFNVTNNVSISKTTGRTVITNMNAKNITAESGTGKYLLKNVVVDELMKINTGTGDIKLDSCDSKNYELETNTGDIEGTILTNKEFTISTHTGDSNTPPADSTVNGTFKASTNTGDVDIKLKK